MSAGAFAGLTGPPASLPAPTPTLPAVAGALEARQLLVRALREAAPGRVLVVDLPAPLRVVETLLAAGPGRALVWQPPDGDGAALAGWGVAARIDAHGAGRMAEVRARADALWARLDVVSAQGAPHPRLLGGFGFAEGGDGAPWREFPGAAFTLPRWRYLREGARAWLSFAAEAPFDDGAQVAAVSELDRLLSLLARGPRGHVIDLEDASDGAVADEPRAGFEARVEAIRAEIAAGRFEKIVAARAVTLALPERATVAAVLARLAHGAPACTRFAFREAHSAFVGATPERLLAVAGLQVRGEALAGTARAGSDAGAALLGSGKDLVEHAPVVRAIAAALAPRCETLVVPAQPIVRQLGAINHLLTPISGRLRVRTHILELAAALHPTPAVGGAPVAPAQRWIGAHEPVARGWYAGPVGWFDAAGDGELAVALRSGVLAGGGRQATLFAGAGIVAASDPAAEWVETELKLDSLSRALREAARGEVA